MELELKKLEDLSEAIVNDFQYMKSREKLMRDTNGKNLKMKFRFTLQYPHRITVVNALTPTPIGITFQQLSVLDKLLNPNDHVIYQQSSFVVQCVLYGGSTWPSSVAGVLPQTVLQGQEIDRMRWELSWEKGLIICRILFQQLMSKDGPNSLACSWPCLSALTPDERPGVSLREALQGPNR
eukprot:sb/3471635/